MAGKCAFGLSREVVSRSGSIPVKTFVDGGKRQESGSIIVAKCIIWHPTVRAGA